MQGDTLAGVGWLAILGLIFQVLSVFCFKWWGSIWGSKILTLFYRADVQMFWTVIFWAFLGKQLQNILQTNGGAYP